MRVILVGASGFIGEVVLRALVSSGHSVIAISRHLRPDSSGEFTADELQTVQVDVADNACIKRAGARLREADALIYLAGLLRENLATGQTFRRVHVDGVRNLLEFASGTSISRWIQMSALGVTGTPTTDYFRTKWEAEQLVRKSSLNWTILRPSVVFSDEPTNQMNFVGELGRVAKLAPFLPVFGDGKYRMQPVSIKDVAQALTQSLTDERTNGNVYELGGPDVFPYVQIIRMIAQAQGKSKPIVHIPFWAIGAIAAMFDRFTFFPVTRDQLAMLRAENFVRDPQHMLETREIFDLPLHTFASGLKGYFHKT